LPSAPLPLNVRHVSHLSSARRRPYCHVETAPRYTRDRHSARGASVDRQVTDATATGALVGTADPAAGSTVTAT